MNRKGQMFIMTMVFLVGLIFSVQALLLGKGSIDVSAPPYKYDPYIVRNMESIFQSALDSSGDCYTANDNVQDLIHAISGSIKSGRQITVSGKIDCSGGVWPASPKLRLEIIINSEGSETKTSLELTRT